MQRGPRLYNALSDEERLARLRRKAARKEKEVHRVRRNRIVALFLQLQFYFWNCSYYGPCTNR